MKKTNLVALFFLANVTQARLPDEMMPRNADYRPEATPRQQGAHTDPSFL